MSSPPPVEFVKKRKQLTFSEKLDFLDRIEKGEKLTKVAREFGISSSTASGIFKDRSKIKLLHDHYKLNPHRKRMRLSLYNDIDEAVHMWFRQMRAKNMPVNGPMLQQKAREFAIQLGHKSFEGSSGWLSRFRERHDMSVESMRGENNSDSSFTTIGMTDEEIIAYINHSNSQPECILSDVSAIYESDIKNEPEKDCNDVPISCSTSNLNEDISSYINDKHVYDTSTPSDSLNDYLSKTKKQKNNFISNHVNQILSQSSHNQNANFCDSTNEAPKYNVNYTVPKIKLPEAISLMKSVTSFFEQQSNIPKHIYDALESINDYMLGELSEKAKQKKITDFFKTNK